MIIIVGASASGKTEIAEILFNKYGIKKCITATTRNPRPGEKDKVDYHFFSKDEFKSLVSKGEFIEHIEYQNNYYGLMKKSVADNSLVVMDPKGANKLIDIYGAKMFVVLIKTSYEQRKARMIKRGDSDESIQKRLGTDDITFADNKFNRVDLVIQNDDERLNYYAKVINDSYYKYVNAK